MIEKFNRLTALSLIELYLLSGLFFLTIYLYRNEIFFNNIIKDNGILKSENTKKGYSKESEIFLTNFITRQSKEADISILFLAQNNNTIRLKTSGNFESSMEFLRNISNRLELLSFNISLKDDSALLFETVFLNSKFYNGHFTASNLFDLSNPFFKSQKLKDANPSSNPVLNAIINDFVCINGKWCKKGETVDRYRVKSFTKNSVILEDSSTLNNLELMLFKGN